MIRKRILLIGRNPVVLANLASALSNEGFNVQTTDLVEQASQQFNAAEFDLIAFGRGVDEQTNARLKADFRAQYAAVHLIDGLAPVVPLLVKQIKQSLSEPPVLERTLIKFTCQQANGLLIQLTVSVASQIKIVLYQLDAVHRTEQKTLISEYVLAGNHSFRINDQPSTKSTINFLVAETDKQDLMVLPLR